MVEELAVPVKPRKLIGHVQMKIICEAWHISENFPQD